MEIALLIPVTSRGTPSVETNARALLSSIAETTSPTTRAGLSIFFGVDCGDPVCDPTLPGALDLVQLVEETMPSARARVHAFEHPPGHVCSIWRDLAREAFGDSCNADLAILLGDDVRLVSVGWADAIQRAFQAIARKRDLPFGFACVAFADESFPSFPSFPVLHRTHAEWMPSIVPEAFINQDADPFLFQVYRAFGAAQIEPGARLRNAVGGAGAARYNKLHVEDWTGTLLTEARATAARWLTEQLSCPREIGGLQLITLDVLVPTFRAPVEALERIISLSVPPGMSTQIIIVCDRPGHAAAEAAMAALQAAHRDNPMVRVRVNHENLGAGPTRNRALVESAADWVLFLDDDVLPDEDLLAHYASAILSHPNATGFVGLSELPRPTSARQAGVCLSGVSFFWEAARTFPTELELPWGVTANLCTRRMPGEKGGRGGVWFGEQFPRTGGGEDIDFCLRLREQVRCALPGSVGLVAAPAARVVHPWWDGGAPSVSHFAGWAAGDGMLTELFPEHTYWNWPNLAETLGALCALCALCLALAATAAFAALQSGDTRLLRGALLGAASTMVAAVICVAADLALDAWNEMCMQPSPACAHLPRRVRLLGVAYAVLTRTASEAGRLRGYAARRVLFWNLCRRFNWFALMWTGAPAVERAAALQRVVVRATLCVTVFAAVAAAVQGKDD